MDYQKPQLLCLLANSFQQFKEKQCLHFQGQAVQKQSTLLGLLDPADLSHCKHLHLPWHLRQHLKSSKRQPQQKRNKQTMNIEQVTAG